MRPPLADGGFEQAGQQSPLVLAVDERRHAERACARLRGRRCREAMAPGLQRRRLVLGDLASQLERRSIEQDISRRRAASETAGVAHRACRQIPVGVGNHFAGRDAYSHALWSELPVGDDSHAAAPARTARAASSSCDGSRPKAATAPPGSCSTTPPCASSAVWSARRRCICVSRRRSASVSARAPWCVQLVDLDDHDADQTTRSRPGADTATIGRRPSHLPRGRWIEAGVLSQHLALEVAQFLLQPAALAQQLGELAVARERFRLPPASIEGQEALGLKAFAQGVLRCEHLELTGDVAVAAQADRLLRRRGPPGRRAAARRAAWPRSARSPASMTTRPAGARARATAPSAGRPQLPLGIAVGEREPAFIGKPLEPGSIDIVGSRAQDIARRHRHDAAVANRPAKA